MDMIKLIQMWCVHIALAQNGSEDSQLSQAVFWGGGRGGGVVCVCGACGPGGRGGKVKEGMWFFFLLFLFLWISD